MIDKHFGNKNNPLNKILNRNKVKLSFSCTPNIGTIIKSHNAKLIKNDNENPTQGCNCNRKSDCPMQGNCKIENVVYAAKVILQNPSELTNDPSPEAHPPTLQPRPRRSTRQTRSQTNDNEAETVHHTQNNRKNPNGTPQMQYDEFQGSGTRTNETNNNGDRTSAEKRNEMTYIGAAENFKQRYANHLKSFRHEQYKAETELSKYIWKLKSENLSYKIQWKILRKTSGYNKISKTCNLCLNEKLEILKFRDKNALLNTRNELVSKCRHENKHILANFVEP